MAATANKKSAAGKGGSRAGNASGKAGNAGGRREGTRGKAGNGSQGRSNAALSPEEPEDFFGAEVMILLSFAAAVLLFLSNFHLCGVAGDYLRTFQLGIFGTVGYIAPFLLFVGTCFYLSNQGNMTAMRKMLASVAAVLVLCGFAQLLFGTQPEAEAGIMEYYRLSSESGVGGGLAGGVICAGLTSVIGSIGAFLVLLVCLAISVVCITERSLVKAVKRQSDAAYQYAREDMSRRREERGKRQEERRQQKEQRVRGVNLGSTTLVASEETGEEGFYGEEGEFMPEAGYAGQGGYAMDEGYAVQGGYPMEAGYNGQGGYPADEGYGIQGAGQAENEYGRDGGRGEYSADDGYGAQDGYLAEDEYDDFDDYKADIKYEEKGNKKGNITYTEKTKDRGSAVRGSAFAAANTASEEKLHERKKAADPADIFVGKITPAAYEGEDVAPFVEDKVLSPAESAQRLVAEGISRLSDLDGSFGRPVEPPAFHAPASEPSFHGLAAELDGERKSKPEEESQSKEEDLRAGRRDLQEDEWSLEAIRLEPGRSVLEKTTAEELPGDDWNRLSVPDFVQPDFVRDVREPDSLVPPVRRYTKEDSMDIQYPADDLIMEEKALDEVDEAESLGAEYREKPKPPLLRYKEEPEPSPLLRHKEEPESSLLLRYQEDEEGEIYMGEPPEWEEQRARAGRLPADRDEGQRSGNSGAFVVSERDRRVVTASGKIIESDTEALQKKLESRRREAQENLETGEASVQQQIREKERQPKREYIFPPVTLLKRGNLMANANSQQEYKDTAIKLQQTLRDFGVGVTVTNISCGPSVTRYELHPEQGVKVSKIVGLADDIKLSLAAEDIRIEAPIPGKSAVGIEVPNKETTMVYLRELLESEAFREHPSRMAFAVGKDIGGQVVVTDIAKMPHLLIAGATGSGKSVCINTLIMSILFKANPDEVKLIMVDPKVVELSVYNGIPHLLIPVVTDPKKASGALNWAVAEMQDRYKKFAECNVRNLGGYNARIDKLGEDVPEEEKPKKMPQIIIIVDELADLMMVAPGEVEDAICRLAQLARAAGIHLVIATQRPSVNVITGLIKANVPSRIAFSVSSGVDSRTIIDMYGAEKLLGKGDMLFFPSGIPKPQRVQGAFVSDSEVQKVVEFLTEQGLSADYDPDVERQMSTASAMAGSTGAGGGSGRDEYFEQAGRFIIEKDKASIGMLQRMFKIGFNRAARIMDQLADAGVVGEEEGTKPRKILITMEEFESLLQER